jgi:hypothetical protein
LKQFIRYKLNELLLESKKDKYEYQSRDIGGSMVYYKRKKGEKLWSFTDEKDFNKNSDKDNTVKFKEKKK